MASALDAVLQLKASQEAKALQDNQQIVQSVQLFNQARQQAIQNNMQQMTYKAGLAEKGLIPDNTMPGGFRYDATLTNPLANIISATKLQADAKTAGNPQIYSMAGNALSQLTGGGTQQPQQTPIQETVSTNAGVGQSVPVTPASDITQQRDLYGDFTPQAKAAQENLKSQQGEYGKNLQTTKEDFNSLLNLGDNLVASLKSSNKQSGGAGLIPGALGKIASDLKLPDTGNIAAMKAIKRDTALAYSRALVGGARGMATVFNKVLDSLPDSGSTEQQQGSIVAEMNLTAYAMLKAKKQLGLTDSQINKMGPTSLESIISEQKANMTPEETSSLYSAMGNRFANIAPRKQIDISGNVTEPQTNPLSKAILGNKPLGAVYHSASTGKYYDAKGKEL